MASQKKQIIYDATLNLLISDNCNLDCQYCITKQILNKLEAPSINTSAFIQTLENTGKTFNINFCGFGEPFLIPNFIEVCRAITKKHYISLITNLTSPLVKEFVQKIDPQRVIKVDASAHLKELERKNLLNIYFNNLLLLRNKGFDVKVFGIAHPSFFNEIKKYKKIFLEKGVELNFSSFFGNYNNKKYPQSYTKKEMKIFGIFPKFNNRYKLLCNAGYNSGVVLPNGDIEICGQVKESIGNIYKEINFNKKLKSCSFESCACPPTVDNPYLFNKALKEMAPVGSRLIYYFKDIEQNFSQFIKKLKIFLKQFFFQPVDHFIGQIGIFLKNNFPKLYFKLKRLKHS